MTKHVTMHRPQRRFSFWQRTLTIFFLALVVLIIAFALLYTRSFPLISQDASDGLGTESASMVAGRQTTLQPATTATDTSGNAAGDQAPGAWLFNADRESANEGRAAADAAPTMIVVNAAPATTSAATDANSSNRALDDRPELLRDLRLSEQALAEEEPRVATELLLALTANYPTFRPTEVADRLYAAYLALGDQAMRREARAEALGYYNQAGQLAVSDSSPLQRRRDALTRLFPNVTEEAGATAPTTNTGNEAAPTPLPVGQVTTPTQSQAAAVRDAVSPPTPAPVAPVQIQVAPVCPDEHIALTAPTVGAQVSGTVAVVGSVRLEDLWFYKLEWAAANSEEFAYFGGTARTVDNGLLGRLDTTELPNGEHRIRVTVVDQTGNYPPPCEVSILVEN